MRACQLCALRALNRASCGRRGDDDAAARCAREQRPLLLLLLLLLSTRLMSFQQLHLKTFRIRFRIRLTIQAASSRCSLELLVLAMQPLWQRGGRQQAAA